MESDCIRDQRPDWDCGSPPSGGAGTRPCCHGCTGRWAESEIGAGTGAVRRSSCGLVMQAETENIPLQDILKLNI